ncbi:hypothetical protein FA95DRAFT_1502225 [Auriscalpium vulgare]|uniref:Uncharacterized protein n=1 Tax=Auriscalpium vulgare TaxID=40419 RepID=A0ACB8R9N9_9AGAM|nr:hypothetical protein FA95DRAFT_1502225 [Auriscalpium vulgare]
MQQELRFDHQQAFKADPKVAHFQGAAGAPMPGRVARTFDTYQDRVPDSAANEWAPFRNKLEWEIARWAKTRGPTSTAFTELLKIEEVRERLDLSFKSTNDLNDIIDNQLPPSPEFKCEEITVSGETYDLHFRDVMDCIQSLYGTPEFLSSMAFAPERHYVDEDSTKRVYSEMNTGKWWWDIQVLLEKSTPGATVLPLILSSDKTQVTTFRNQSAYPLYLTLGNISKADRRQPSKRSQVLVGYLSTARLTHIKEDETRRRAVANLFHACVGKIMAPTRRHALSGLPMASADGVVRRCHPIFALFVGDYPEQALVTCTKYGECPKCFVPPDELEVHKKYGLRSITASRAALRTLGDGPAAYIAACRAAGIKPVHHPFWEGLPYSNVYVAVTPDILHQLYQGVVKHLLSWLTLAFGAEEINARCTRLPPNHHVRLFKNGLSILSRVSGQEHKDICRILMGLVVGLEPVNSPAAATAADAAEAVRATRSLLDFLYLAQYPSHSDETLGYVNKALRRFHANKAVFQRLGIRKDFNLPKLHALLHYVDSIELFGTTDGYNTEATERLHIDYAKDAYRSTNHKDVYPQMTKWLERRERVLLHTNYVAWRVQKRAAAAGAEPTTAPAPIPRLHIARAPNFKSVTVAQLRTRYGARDFDEAFMRYILRVWHPHLSVREAANLAIGMKVPFRAVATYNTIKLSIEDPQHRDDAPRIKDTIHARPSYLNTRGKAVYGRFDTALVDVGAEDEGLQGYCVAQVRAIFSLPIKAHEAAYPPGYSAPTHLAYVEWFTPFERAADADHLMYRVARKYKVGGQRVASVIPVEEIHRSAHLFPKFGPSAPREWTSENVLDKCRTFFVSSFLDKHTYITVY